MALIDQYTEKELRQIVAQSTSMKQVIDKLGYSTHSGSNNLTVKDRLKKYNIDTSHFIFVKGTKRNEENIFIEDSTASQATLRRWYLKGEYTPYICSICGQEPFWQGKELTLILDHINGHNHDDRLENLRWVCPNCNQQLDTTGFKQIKNSKAEKKYYCFECGKEISKFSLSGLCTKCANKAKRVCKRPSREELKQLIRTTSFTAIGTQFGVTDNAIRKWCDEYNLPRTKKEIKKYSDKDWELI
jgi:bacterioferritin-associated ferredoxin